jgi:hypothetical protein
LYFTKEAYGCYNCGHRGTSINFLKENNYSSEEIAQFIIQKKKLTPNKYELESIIKQINAKSIEDVHSIFENSKFFPGTACLHIGDYGKKLKDYHSIRQTIWKEYHSERKNLAQKK